MSTKTKLRDGIARFLFLAGLTAPERRGRGRLSIATFHRVLPEAERLAYPYPGLAVTPQELDAFLAYFTEHFDCGALSTQHERHLGGAAAARPLLALTFDDGQRQLPARARGARAAPGQGVVFRPRGGGRAARTPVARLPGFRDPALQRMPGGAARLMRILAAAGLSGSGPRSVAENAAGESKGLALEARLRLVDALAQASGSAERPNSRGS